MVPVSNRPTTGYRDQVKNHYGRIFGAATMLAVLGAGAQLSQPQSEDDNRTTPEEQLAAGLGRQWSQVGSEMVRRNMRIQPTLRVRPGYRFNVLVTQDLILEPYTATGA